MRDPQDLHLVIDAIHASYMQRFGKEEAKSSSQQSWAALGVAGLQAASSAVPAEHAPKRRLSTWEDLVGSAHPVL